MTKTNRLRIKLSALTLALTLGAIYLDGIRKTGSGMESAGAYFGEILLGIFAGGFAIATTVYLFVEDNN